MDGSRSARMAHQRMERAHRRAIEHSMKALRAPTTPAAVTVRNGLCEPCEPCHPRPWGANTAAYRVALGGHPQAGQSRAGSATQRQACKACHAGFSGPDGESIDRITLKDGSNFHRVAGPHWRVSRGGRGTACGLVASSACFRRVSARAHEVHASWRGRSVTVACVTSAENLHKS